MNETNPTADPLESLKIIEPQPPLPDAQISDIKGPLLENLTSLGWKDLLPVQKKSIPYLLDAQNIMVQAKTGSGKTGAFVIPLLQVIEQDYHFPQAMILVPTRELALQVTQEIEKLSKGIPVVSLAVYGGVGYKTQLDTLKKGAHIVVGTPGRILDHLMKGTLDVKSLRDLILDEADEMLSMGFYPDMKRIIQFLPKNRCTFMFSATMSQNVIRLGKEFIQNPKFLNLSPSNQTISKMDRIFYKVPAMDKDKALLQIIEVENPDNAIIFCNTKKDVSYINEYLQGRNFPVGMISGDLTQTAREEVLKDIKFGNLRFLVATDVAARGIDISNLTHVIMYDHPDDPEVYIHRSGRTARAGNKGLAISLVTELEELSLKETAQRFGIQFIEKNLKTDDEMENLVHERTIAFLEQEMRDLKQFESIRTNQMLPLLKKLMNSEEEQMGLGLLLYKLYWKKFIKES